MRKYLTPIIIAMFLTGLCFGQLTIDYRSVSNPRLLERLLNDRIGTLDDEVTTLQGQQSGLFSNIGTGDVFYVDSVTGSDSDTGLTWALAKATIDAAVGLCTDGNHDVIYVASGHEETLTADIAFDVDDITVIGIGSGTLKPEITLDTTTDSLVIDAIGVTLYNLSLIAGVSEVAGGITLEDESDYATIYCIEFPEPADTTYEFDVGIQFVTGADNVTIAYCTFTNIGANAGCTAAIDFGAAAIDGASIIGNNIKGDMLVAGIFSDQADTNLLIANNMIRNTDADQHAIELTSTATGIIVNNHLLTDDLDTCLDPGSCATYENYANTSVDQTGVLVPLAEIADKPGNVWYVDGNVGTDAVTNGRSWARPFDTIDYASAACTADNGDIIYVAPGHTEALTTAAMTLDEDGVTVIGIGVGSDRPTVTFAHADSSIVISADDYCFKNIIFSSITAATNETIDITGPGAVLDGCMWIDDGTNESQICVTVDADAENTTIKNCVFYSADATGPTSAISIVGGVVDRLIIDNCRIWGDYSDAGIQSDQINTNCLIKDCIITNNESGDHAIQLSGAMTGEIVNCMLYGDTPTAILDPGSMKCFNNFASSAIDQESYAIPFEESVGVNISGSVLYLDNSSANSSDAAANGGSWLHPLDTLSYAVAACSADNGDVIYVAPGHTEALTTSAVTLDVDGVSVIGLGVKSDRPTITFAHANSSIVISADDFKIKNFVFSSITATTDETIDITGPGAVLEDCTWIETGDFEHTISVTVDAAAENTTIRNCEFYGAGTGATSAISIVGGVVDHLVIEGCRIWGDFDDAGIQSDQINTNALIKDCVITNRESGDHAIQLSGAMTGEIINCMLYGDTPTAILDPGSMKCFNNFASTGIDSPAWPIPESDSEGRTSGPGLVFYVDSGTPGAGDGRSWQEAVATLDAAVDLCSSLRGDTIYVAPGHTETLGSSSDGVDVDYSNITIIGIGSGQSVPFFDYDTVTDEFVIAGDNVHIKNLRFHTNAPTVNVAIDIEGGAENWVIEDCVFDAETVNTDYFDTVITVQAASHNGTLKNCRFYAGAGSTVAGLHFLNADFTQVINNQFYGDYSTAAILNDATASVHIMIKHNTIFNGTTGGIAGLNTEPGIELLNTTTGVIADNSIFCDVATPEASIVAADCFLTRNTYSEIESTAGSRLIGDDQSIDVDIVSLAGKGLGQIWYVDSAGSGEDGRSWASAFTTINLAEAACTADANDIILVAAGHNENLTGANAVDLDVAGISVIGLGRGSSRPRLDFDDDAAEITISQANITLKNIQLRPGLTATASRGIDIEAGGLYALIEDCAFLDGEAATTDEFLDGIIVHSSAIGTTIRNCTYHCTGTDGDTFINLDQGAAGNVTIEGCTVFGDFDEAAIWASTQVCTNLNIHDNVITNNNTGEMCIEFQGAATGHASGNMMYADTAGSIFDPGSLKCMENYGTTSIDESGVLIPGPMEEEDSVGNVLGVNDAANLGVTTSVVEDIDGSLLERAEHLKIISDDILAALQIAGVGIGNVYYVDSVGGNSSYDGTTWELAEATLTQAYDDTTTNTGSIIFLAPNHVEDITSAASIAIDQINTTIIGIGHGDSRPMITLSETASSIDVTAADNRFENIIFQSITADSTVCFALNAAADGTQIINCDFTATGAGIEFLSAITFASGTDDVTIKGCKFIGPSTQATEAIQATTGVCQRMTIAECQFYGAWTAAAIYSSQADTDVMVRDNIVENTSTGVHAIEFSGNALGALLDNRCYADTYGSVIDPGRLKCYGNLVTTDYDVSGVITPSVPQHEDAIHGTGRVFYVDASGSNGDGTTWATAVTTLDAAIALCTADRGDFIYVAQGHTETFGAADGFDVDIAGISIIGLGNGLSAPTFVFTAGNSEVAVSDAGDNALIQNLRFHTSADSVLICLDIEDSANYVTVKDCVFHEVGDNTGTDEFDEHIQIGVCTGTVIDNCIFRAEAADAVSAVSSSSATVYTTIKNCQIMGDYSTACIAFDTGVNTDIHILDNNLINGDLVADNGLNSEPAIEVTDGSGGFVKGNFIASDVATGLLMRVADDLVFMSNRLTDEDGDDNTDGDESAAAGVATFADG